MQSVLWAALFVVLVQSCHGLTLSMRPGRGPAKALRMSSYETTSSGRHHSLSFEVAGKQMTFETGKIGRQAGGSVVARTMDTMVYTTVCAERESTPVDFTPLRVDFFARYSAVGQTVGAFHRRDSRGDDTEILVARLIDRPIRPMIKEGWQHETQILSWVLSYDKKHSPDALAICSSSAAMMVSEVPMVKPVAGVEVGIIDGEIVNPTKEQMVNSTLQMTLAGTKDGILMIEGVADFLPEEKMIEALRQGHAAIGVICDAIDAFAALSEGTRKPKKLDTLRVFPTELLDRIDDKFGDAMQEALSIGDKQQRGKACADVEATIKEHFVGSGGKPAAASINNDKKSDDEDPVAPEEEEEVAVVNPVDAASDQVLEEDEASELNMAAIAAAQAAQAEVPDPLNVKIAIKKLLVRDCAR